MLDKNALMVSQESDNASGWEDCRYLTASVLPVRRACNLDCPFCFSKSSISLLESESAKWSSIDLDAYFLHAIKNGANRLVVTGGGEPLLKPERVLQIIKQGSRWFNEIACFTNGTYLTKLIARQLQEAGLSYLCYSRHHDDDASCQKLMGNSAPSLDVFFNAAQDIKVRATCVMNKGYIESAEDAERYMEVLSAYGVQEFTFKHTYVAYDHSVYADSKHNHWARNHAVNIDPFEGQGVVIDQLPWGPKIRRMGNRQVCFYYEPDPEWELENQLCRSVNLLSDGNIFASLEDQRSQLYLQK